MKKQNKEVSVKDPDTDEIFVPWGTMHEELIALGLINAGEKEINKNG